MSRLAANTGKRGLTSFRRAVKSSRKTPCRLLLQRRPSCPPQNGSLKVSLKRNKYLSFFVSYNCSSGYKHVILKLANHCLCRLRSRLSKDFRCAANSSLIYFCHLLHKHQIFVDHQEECIIGGHVNYVFCRNWHFSSDYALKMAVHCQQVKAVLLATACNCRGRRARSILSCLLPAFRGRSRLLRRFWPCRKQNVVQ